jgi:putative lipoprotein
MNGTIGRNVLLIFICCALACTSDSEKGSATVAEAPRAAEILKGHAQFGHEVRTIRPCGADEALWAIDSTNVQWELHQELAPGAEPYEEVFVAVSGNPGETLTDGFGVDYSGSFYVDRVVYAATEGWGCDLDLTRFLFRLSGNEPFWSLTVTDTATVLNRMDAPQQVWGEVTAEASDSGFSYVGGSGESGSVKVSISDEPCRDTMSGAYHAYSASVVVNGEVLRGCAIRGSDKQP